jgi:Ca-activated chloride channel family protein
VRELGQQGDSARRVRVFTIAYSSGAAGAADTLARIAAASGGKSYEGSTSDIESVYRSISSFF